MGGQELRGLPADGGGFCSIVAQPKVLFAMTVLSFIVILSYFLPVMEAVQEFLEWVSVSVLPKHSNSRQCCHVVSCKMGFRDGMLLLSLLVFIGFFRKKRVSLVSLGHGHGRCDCIHRSVHTCHSLVLTCSDIDWYVPILS